MRSRVFWFAVGVIPPVVFLWWAVESIRSGNVVSVFLSGLTCGLMVASLLLRLANYRRHERR